MHFFFLDTLRVKSSLFRADKCLASSVSKEFNIQMVLLKDFLKRDDPEKGDHKKHAK